MEYGKSGTDTCPAYRGNVLTRVNRARPVNPTIFRATTDAIPTKYRRDTAWRFGALTIEFKMSIPVAESRIDVLSLVAWFNPTPI